MFGVFPDFRLEYDQIRERDGKAIRWRVFGVEAEALEAAGQPE